MPGHRSATAGLTREQVARRLRPEAEALAAAIPLAGRSVDPEDARDFLLDGADACPEDEGAIIAEACAAGRIFQSGGRLYPLARESRPW